MLFRRISFGFLLSKPVESNISAKICCCAMNCPLFTLTSGMLTFWLAMNYPRFELERCCWLNIFWTLSGTWYSSSYLPVLPVLYYDSYLLYSCLCLVSFSIYSSSRNFGSISSLGELGWLYLLTSKKSETWELCSTLLTPALASIGVRRSG